MQLVRFAFPTARGSLIDRIGNFVDAQLVRAIVGLDYTARRELPEPILFTIVIRRYVVISDLYSALQIQFAMEHPLVPKYSLDKRFQERDSFMDAIIDIEREKKEDLLKSLSELNTKNTFLCVEIYEYPQKDPTADTMTALNDISTNAIKQKVDNWKSAIIDTEEYSSGKDSIELHNNPYSCSTNMKLCT